MEATSRTCTGCDSTKPIELFSFSNKSKGRRHSRCKTCFSKTMHDWYVAHPDRHYKWKKSTPEAERGFQVKYKYNLTWDRYLELWNSQNQSCAICRTPIPLLTGIHVDHDHNCCPGDRSCGGCVRGLLCPSCNKGIGHLRDNAEICFAAATYLTTKPA